MNRLDHRASGQRFLMQAEKVNDELVKTMGKLDPAEPRDEVQRDQVEDLRYTMDTLLGLAQIHYLAALSVPDPMATAR